MKRWIPIFIAITLFGGLAIGQVVTRGGGNGWTSGGTTTSTTNTVVLTPGPLQVGGAGISTDGGLCVGQACFTQNSAGGPLTFNAAVNVSYGNTIVSSTATGGFASSGAGSFSSTTASGGNGFQCTTNGCRFDIGAGSTDYFSSDGTTITAAGEFAAGGGITARNAASTLLNIGTAGTGYVQVSAAGAITLNGTIGTNNVISSTFNPGTPGSGTGITVNFNGRINSFVHKVTVLNTAMTAAATTDITIWTLPAKARLTSLVADYTVVFAGGALTDVDVTCGKTAGANEYLLTHDVDTAIGTYGDVAAEIGAALLSATYANINWTTQAIICRFTCAGANCNAATTGTAVYYIEGMYYP